MTARRASHAPSGAGVDGRRRAWPGAVLLLLTPLLALPSACSRAGAPAAAADGDCATVAQVADGVYVRRGHDAPVFEADDLANVGFVVGERSVAVVDTGGSVAEGRALLCALRRVTALPISHVVNTHVHPDHLFGNAAFTAESDVSFVGHQRLPRALALRGPHYVSRANEIRGTDWTVAQVLVPPDVLVDDELSLDLGGRTLVLTAHAAAHTDNDLSVRDDATGTLWAGDLLFVEHIPVIDGSVNGWIGTLEAWAAGAAPGVLVPGHGPPDAPWREALAANLRYLGAGRDGTRAAIAAGTDLQRAQETVATEAAADWDLAAEYHRRNVAAAYAELEWE